LKRFDILVIGSGMGGMCAAARLAHEGYRVLVIESQARIGGRCSTWCHEGFKLTTGVVGIERCGIVEGFFHSLGLPFDVRPADDLCYLIDGKPVAVTTRGGMRRLLTASGGDTMEVDRVMEAIARGLKWQAPSSDLTLKEWLGKYIRDGRLEHIFQTLVSVPLMAGMEDISAAAFFDFIRNLKRVPRFGYAPGGAIALPEALEGHILKHHGEVWTQAEAIGIRIENHAARGARIRHLDREKTVAASAVISNIGPKKTARLAGRKNLDRDERHILDKRLRPARSICLQIATDEPLLTRNHLWVTGCRRISRLHQPTAVCPELAPTGRHLIVAMATVPWADQPLDLDAEVAICRNDLAGLFPGFWDKAEILSADSYSGDRPAMHAWPGRDAPIKTSVINLYNVGDGVKSPGLTGLPAVVDAAKQCATDVCQRINLIKSLAAAS
jgi:phytoene dehydrogenase-like protein